MCVLYIQAVQALCFLVVVVRRPCMLLHTAATFVPHSGTGPAKHKSSICIKLRENPSWLWIVVLCGAAMCGGGKLHNGVVVVLECDCTVYGVLWVVF